jgi:hypothetical protein
MASLCRYDEMLFANLFMRQISRFDAHASALRLQSRKVEQQLERLNIEQAKQQKVHF